MTLARHAAVTQRGTGASAATLPDYWRSSIPDYCALLAEANGLVLHDGLFRVFGLGEDAICRDAIVWNQSSWRKAYALPDCVALWAENVFGDQFGVDVVARCIIRLSCEGGAIERLPFETPTNYLESLLDADPSIWIDVDLVEAAIARGIRPSLREHLDFAHPLMMGGKAEASNIQVLDGDVHLEMLGQLLEQTRHLPNGTRIARFHGQR